LEPHGHLCKSFPLDARAIVCPLCNQVVPTRKGLDPNDTVNSHINAGCPDTSQTKTIYTNSCSFGNCTKRELVPIICRSCQKPFCIKHRLEQDHECIPSKKAKKMSLPKISNKFTEKAKKDNCNIM
jgi:hypothetical protein